MAANILIIGVCQFTAYVLSELQDEKLLTLHRRSVIGGDTDIVAAICAHDGLQYWDHVFTLSHSQVILQEARPEIGDAPLMLVSEIGQSACRLPFYI